MQLFVLKYIGFLVLLPPPCVWYLISLWLTFHLCTFCSLRTGMGESYYFSRNNLACSVNATLKATLQLTWVSYTHHSSRTLFAVAWAMSAHFCKDPACVPNMVTSNSGSSSIWLQRIAHSGSQGYSNWFPLFCIGDVHHELLAIRRLRMTSALKRGRECV